MKPTPEEVQHWVGVFKHLFGLDAWLFHTDYRALEENDDVASSNVNWEYLNCQFIFDLNHSSWNAPGEDIARVVAHEVFHVITAPLYDTTLTYAKGKNERKLACKINELVVSRFERSPLVDQIKEQFPYSARDERLVTDGS